MITWLQYYKLKPLQPLFSRCENDCFIAHAFLSNKHNQKAIQSHPIKMRQLWTKWDFVARKTYSNFSCQDSNKLWYAQIKQWFLHIPEHIRRNYIKFQSKLHLKATLTNQISLFKNCCLGRKRRSKVMGAFRKFLEWGAETLLQWLI